ncbi:DUF4247 domain-containing protein [Acidimicrobiia bacterium EGI L10123]|uniref:DUF4247 domain-containing protein n=1 Tax=Salinilacustrithrix flava TaxID=2957203 RepID=UPI003D7C29F3|nr:DUF4247 domain-containing protein [Acidimicrobiia bacterium EGI L10123]
MSDVPGGRPDQPDPWDAWRGWSAGSDGPTDAPGAWDAWKSWEYTPRARPPMATGAGCSGCGSTGIGVIIAIVVFIMLLSSFIGSIGASDLSADDLIASIDALPVTGPRDQRPPDTGAGETTTFPAPGAVPVAVADQIQSVRAPSQRDSSGESVFLLYEEATVAIQPVADGSEVVVFDDNRAATRRFPSILLLPGWSGTLDDFDTRARSRGGIGGFRGGGGGFGK